MEASNFWNDRHMAFYFLIDSYVYGDRKEYEEYIDKVESIVESYGGEYILRSSNVKAIVKAECPTDA